MDKYLLNEPRTPGSDPVLLLDNSTVEDLWGVRQIINFPFKDPRNPLLMPDMPWEDQIAQPSVLYDESSGLWRMWYTSIDRNAYVHQFELKDWNSERDGRSAVLSYAESRDGVHWNRPMLKDKPYKNHPATNIVHQGHEKCASGRVLINHPSTGHAGRFLLTYKDNLPDADEALCLAYSDDGIYWQEDTRNPASTWMRDTWQNMVFDATSDRWLLFTRPLITAGKPNVPGGPSERNYKRRVALMSGKTPFELEFPRTVLWPNNANDPDFDNFMVTRVGSHFLGFLASMTAPPKMEFNLHLAFSADGLQWKIPNDTKAYIPHGASDQFDSGSVSNAGGFVTVGNKSYIYYRGSRRGQAQGNRNNQGGIGRVDFLPERFMAQMGANTGGFLLTRAFIVSAPELTVNMTVADGYNSDPETATTPPEFAAEILQFSDARTPPQPVRGFTMEECRTPAIDTINQKVTWQNRSDLREFIGKSVFIRFYLKNTGLYSFRFQ